MPKELTVKAIVTGIIVAVVMTAANVYLGLYAGMTVSASIPAAVIAMAIFRGIFKEDGVLESNIVQTMASAGESLAAGVIFTLPALVLVGAWKDFEFWPTFLIATSGGLLGVVFMIPLRRVLIKDNKDLIYPEGVACAEVLQTGAGEDGKKGVGSIALGLLLGGLFKLSSSLLGIFSGSFEAATKLKSSALFVGTDLSPALLSVGYIIRLPIAMMVMTGGAIGFFIAIPLLGTPESLAGLSAIDLSWTLWSTQVRYLGVGAMIVGGLWSIVSVRKGMAQSFTHLKESVKTKGSENKKVQREDQDMHPMGMSLILLLCLMIMFYLYQGMIQHFGITLATCLVMIACSFLFVAVSSTIVGLVGSSNNPVSGMTISALLVSAALFLALGETGQSAILSTLGVASVVCCAACSAGDCSQDLKTGSILKATPKLQQYAQVIGVVIPALVIAPVLTLLHEAYGIGDGLKAPQATLFASITKSLFGMGDLPIMMVVYGMILGVVIIAIDELFLKEKTFRLYIMPVAVGIYLPVTLAVPMVFGGLIRYLVERKQSHLSEGKDQGVLVSSGLIAGEALMGVLVAVYLYLELKKPDFGLSSHLTEWVGLFALILVGVVLYKRSKATSSSSL